ncbi:MAG: T9SS type A sorting domain-containing protein [Bacteroidia bacterium]|nr:T9SS type A sorting domain-containing protein [Bacteroidia bacterium]
MIRHYFNLCLLFFSTVISFGQYTKIGSGGFASGNFGPLRTDTSAAYYSRFAFIYPEATLTNLKHGDSISAISFFHRSFDSMRGNCNMKVFLKSTNQSDFGANSLNWSAESRNSTIKVFDGNPKNLISNSPQEVFFKLDKPYGWDTTGGKRHLEVLVEYSQKMNQVGTMNWFVESSFYVPGFISANESKYLYGSSTNGMDSMTTFSSTIHPTLKIYHPSKSLDLELSKLYSLGTVPLLMKQSDSIKVSVNNVGRDTVVNHKVYLKVTGVNTFTDSLTVSKIAPYKSQTLYFDHYQPKFQGTETINIEVDEDSNSLNNVISKSRVVNYNVYSHADPFSGNTGGIGFNGSTGDFVARFYVDGTSYINQIKVDFNSVGTEFQLGVWDVNSAGLPGKELFITDTSLSVAGTFIMNVLPRISVTNSFYVGIRQTSNTNVGFSYQSEVPVRPHTFYFAAPAGDTSWVSFSPGFDFNFNIQPRLQVANDVATLAIISPKPDSSYQYDEKDSLDIVAQFINYGYQNQSNFPVEVKISNGFGQLEFSKQKVTSIAAGDTSTVVFGKISKYRIGDYTLTASTKLSSDSVTDNDSKTVKFSFIKDHDVAVDQIFSPSNGSQFDLQRDPVQMVVRAINYGVKTQNNLTVRMELVNTNGKILITQDKVINLTGGATTILPFDTIYLPDNGNLTLRAFTMLAIDSFPENDTLGVSLFSRKVDDVMAWNVETPNERSYFSKDTTIVPYVKYRNDGITNQDSTLIYYRIFDKNGLSLFYDSAFQDAPFLTEKQVFFSPIKLDSAGTFTFQTWVFIKDDQVRLNDTITSNFNVINGNDLQILGVYRPKLMVSQGSPSSPLSIVIRNHGNLRASNVKIIVNVENNKSEVIMNDSLYIKLNRLTTDTFEFGVLDFNDVGDYYVKVVNHSQAEDKPNYLDTLNYNYAVRYQNDISLAQHLIPISQDTLELNEIVFPSLQVMNNGLDTFNNLELCVILRNSSNDVVYRDSFDLSQLPPNRASNFNSIQQWSTNISGDYTMHSWLKSSDNNSFNDTLTTSFIVVKRRDALIESIVFPNKDLYKQQLYKPVVVIKNDGLDDLLGVNLSCIVTVDGTNIYKKIKIIAITSGQSKIVEFDSTLSYNQEALAQVSFVIEANNDQVSWNDSLTTSFSFIRGLGVRDYAHPEVVVYPNPFENYIKITANNPISNIRLIDMFGRVVFEENNLNLLNSKFDMDVQKGMYILEVYSGNKWYKVSITKD